jgi:hypothetical protein
MRRETLDDILAGMDRGGFATPAHLRDKSPGLCYIAEFDPWQVGRSGAQVLNVFPDLREIGSHYDVIERNSVGEVLHHRIYPPG